jgi:hypothetical protein
MRTHPCEKSFARVLTFIIKLDIIYKLTREHGSDEAQGVP